MPRLSVHDLSSDFDSSMRELLSQLEKYQPALNFGVNGTPLQNTLNYLQSLGARGVLVQKDAQDPDFLAEHSAYYTKWTYKIQRFCDRLHFFSEPPSNRDALEALDGYRDSDYLGFITLRPIAMSPVGATILRSNQCDDASFIKVKDCFEVHLAGRKFEVHGTPFMQQDNAVGACAQTSVWMALRSLRSKEGRSAFNPAEITNAATRFFAQSRTLPNRSGLSSHQIADVLRVAGYATHLLHFEKPSDAAKLVDMRTTLYPYIESGIPVLLGVVPSNGAAHAILLIGHKWNSTPSEDIQTLTPVDEGSVQIQFIDSATWAYPFVCHNDNTGPYLDISDNSNVSHPYSISQVQMAIPFLGDDIFIDASEARLAIDLLIRYFLPQVIRASEDTRQGKDRGELGPIKIVNRLFLCERKHFRAHVRESAMSDSLKRYYREKWLPRYFWLMELNSFDNYGTPQADNLPTRLGEVILDASSEFLECPFLSIYFSPQMVEGLVGGILFDRNAFNGDVEVLSVPDGHNPSPLGV